MNKNDLLFPFRTSRPRRQTDPLVRERGVWASLFCGGRQHRLPATPDQLPGCDGCRKEDFEGRPSRAGNFSLLFRNDIGIRILKRCSIGWDRQSVTTRPVEDISPHSAWKNATKAMKQRSWKLPFATPLDGRCERSWATAAKQSQQGNIGTSLSWKSHGEWTTEMTQRGECCKFFWPKMVLKRNLTHSRDQLTHIFVRWICVRQRR